MIGKKIYKILSTTGTQVGQTKEELMTSKRKVLINALEKDLLPFLISKGFKLVLTQDKEKQKMEKWYFPLGKLRRKKGRTEEWINIQFDKRGRALFIPNLRVSKNGKFGHSTCRLNDSTVKTFETWFSMPWFAWPLNDETRAVKTSKKLVGLYPEIEEWFATRKAGPHVRYFK